MKLFFLFGFVSTLGAVVDFLVTWQLLNLGLSAFAGFAIAMLVSATLVYFCHEYLTFGKRQVSRFSKFRLSQFLFSTFLIYVLRVSVYYILTNLGFIEIVALVVALISSVVINFFVSKLLIFRS